MKLQLTLNVEYEEDETYDGDSWPQKGDEVYIESGGSGYYGVVLERKVV